jgi:acyl carrier protein
MYRHILSASPARSLLTRSTPSIYANTAARTSTSILLLHNNGRRVSSIQQLSQKRNMSSSSSSAAGGGGDHGSSAAAPGTFLDVKEVTERVLNVLKNFDKVDKSKLTPTAHFTNDLGLDSLDAVEVVMAFEEEFVLEIPDDVAEKIMSCEDAIKFISQHPQAR